MSKIVLFAYGFRPFFLLAGIWAVVPLATVAWFLHSGTWPADDIALFAWHGHEMIFGFAAAAICGFLLTAVPSWTGTPRVSGMPLAGLVALWIFGRIESFPLAASSQPVAELLAMGLFPALAAVVGIPLVRARNYRNLPFLAFLGALFLADLMFQAPRFDWIEHAPFDALRFGVNVVLLMVVVVGGRIVPAFTRNTLISMGRSAPIASRAWLDRSAIAAAVTVVLADTFAPATQLAGAVAAVAALLLALRLSGWSGRRALDVPLLWVLHLGYAWLVLGLALKALWLLGGFGWAANWLHAITTGAFGTMILGVMTRATLGHTGRNLAISKPIVVAYLLVSLAAALRIWGPWLEPERYWPMLALAVVAWIGAYAIFLLLFGPILLARRVDGRPG